MQIDIDFEVFKALTALRESEADSYNAVLRRLLGLTSQQPTLGGLLGSRDLASIAEDLAVNPPARTGLFGSSTRQQQPKSEAGLAGLLGKYLGGIWFGNVHFPDGTKFRATYKGRTYHAEVKEGQWIGADGKARTSPSDAASAISRTNVNGWRFWHVKMPDDPSWRKLEDLRQ